MEKIKNFAKYFWRGVLMALKLVLALLGVALSAAVILIAAVLFTHIGTVACVQFGNWAGFIYLLDLLAICYFIHVLSDMEIPKGKKKVRVILKQIVLFVIGIVGLCIANWLLWCVGRIPLAIFGQHLPVGITACIGLAICVVAFFIWLAIEYAREYGKKAVGELVVKILGFLAIPIIIALIFILW